ncbi:MAG: RidA family protein [Jatrophihabitantaceae bacterium]
MADRSDAPARRSAAAPRPQGRYVTATIHDGIAYSAGMTPRVDGVLVLQGIVGDAVTAAQARDLAAIAAGNALAAIADVAGGLDNIACCLRMTVYVAAVAEFTGHTIVADGASEALNASLGDRGSVARSAIGVASLPSGAPVEVELTVAVRGAT